MAAGVDPGQGSYAELQARSRQQLAFVNNLLITLALAVLAFAAGQADPAKVFALGGRRYLFGTALVLLAISLLAGLWLALNRLQVFRMDARMARLRELSAALGSEPHAQLARIAYISGLLQGWAMEGRLTRRPERRAVEGPARQLEAAAHLSQSAAADLKASSEIGPKVELVISMLRAWSDKGDVLTWQLFRVQTLAFLAAAALMLIVILAYFYA